MEVSDFASPLGHLRIFTHYWNRVSIYAAYANIQLPIPGRRREPVICLDAGHLLNQGKVGESGGSGIQFDDGYVNQ